MKNKIWIIVLLWLIWCAVVAYNYFTLSNFNILELLKYSFSIGAVDYSTGVPFFYRLGQNLWYFVTLTGLVLAFFGLGQIFFRLIKLKAESYIENFLLSFAFGLGLSAYIIFFLGLGKLLYVSLIVLIIFLLAGTGLFFIIKDKPKVSFNFLSEISLPYFLKFSLVAIFIFAAIINLTASFTPELFYDSLVYHLAIPQVYLQQHQIRPISYNIFSHFPQIMEMIYVICLALKDEILAKLLAWLLGMMTCMAIYVFGKKFFNKCVGFMAAIFFYATPLISMISCTTKIDLATSFFGVLAVLAFFKGKENFRWYLLSGCFAGFSMGTKYVGSFIAMALTAEFIWQLVFSGKASFKNTCRSFLLFGLFIFVFISPWLLRNYIWQGNPVYPYLEQIFGGQAVNLEKLNILLAEQSGAKFQTWTQWVTLPWQLTMKGISSDTAMGPLFLMFLPLIFLVSGENNGRRQLGRIIFFSFLVGFMVTRLWRFHLAASALLCIFLFSFMIETKKKFLGYFVCSIIIIVGSLVFLRTAVTIRIYHDPLNYLIGLPGKTEYLTATHPGYPNPPYAVLDWANKNLEKNACILFLGECRGYYLQRNFIAASVYDENPFNVCLNQSKDAQDLLDKLIGMKVTHILYNGREAERLGSYKIFDWDKEKDVIVNQFWKENLVELYRHNDISLYKLKAVKVERSQ